VLAPVPVIGWRCGGSRMTIGMLASAAGANRRVTLPAGLGTTARPGHPGGCEAFGVTEYRLGGDMGSGCGLCPTGTDTGQPGQRRR
jgi:hypothetical protein